MESLSIGEIRVIVDRLMWLIEGFDDDGRVICRYRTVGGYNKGWSKRAYKFYPSNILNSTKHYGYLEIKMEND